MPWLKFLLAVVIGLGSASAVAQSEEDMQLQRCIWGCLAQSSGNDDPAYHECVERICLAGDSAAPAAASPPETPQVAAQPERATVLSVQERLAALGFDPGPVDGIYGRQTEAAVQAFRASQGLATAGSIDDAFLAALQSAGDAAAVSE